MKPARALEFLRPDVDRARARKTTKKEKLTLAERTRRTPLREPREDAPAVERVPARQYPYAFPRGVVVETYRARGPPEVRPGRTAAVPALVLGWEEGLVEPPPAPRRGGGRAQPAPVRVRTRAAGLASSPVFCLVPHLEDVPPAPVPGGVLHGRQSLDLLHRQEAESPLPPPLPFRAPPTPPGVQGQPVRTEEEQVGIAGEPPRPPQGVVEE